VQPTYGGQKVGAEGDVRTASVLEHPEHLDERLGHQVVGISSGDKLSRQLERRVPVALEEYAVGMHVSAANQGDEFGIAGRGWIDGELRAQGANHPVEGRKMTPLR
jgi:hypothetical protein